jgi:hypothetical protein
MMQLMFACAGLADVSDLAEVHEAADRAARTAESAMGPGLASPDSTGTLSGAVSCISHRPS